jgi:hypothetical protein
MGPASCVFCDVEVRNFGRLYERNRPTYANG